MHKFSLIPALILLALACSSCSRSGAAIAEMERAEALMDSKSILRKYFLGFQT